jgi:hypothetical protein
VRLRGGLGCGIFGVDAGAYGFMISSYCIEPWWSGKEKSRCLENKYKIPL